ncbi:NRAMP family divalent metal transporter [Pseudorhodoplanes sinuspersici]|uniref:Iron transporter n=1 Tax=Pseudorhodoplanes sinuspersici TaxID=1235591 RepID=A0A1W6ZRK6_9HYPH|nr:divalent metal cation transporter [Pseudorhodoplanes sinuspersici]ARP99991.1 iron transporter [Pseudorhodoplanes sinuspersici]RKE71022.1 NRAMP (natural resistance-associated macrophage protein)-like metal ion transporter [Pseudorhodoplanes sinuspersici]
MDPLKAPGSSKQKPSKLSLLGPGLITGAADDDPSGIATYSQAGAQFGFGLLWTVFLTTPFMIAIQLVSANIGRTTGKGIAANAKALYGRNILFGLVALLLIANVINIAADIAAMAEAAYLVVGGLQHEHALIFAAMSVLLQVFVRYRHYAPFLKWLTLVLFLYVGVVFTVTIPWDQVILGTFLPRIELTSDYFTLLVAVLGTTISPYLFFWQASQEVEDMKRRHHKRPLNTLTRGGGNEMRRMKIDTTAGMIFSNAVAYFIMLTTAATLHAHGITNIDTAADAAQALRPIAGDLAFFLFALGIIGTGLLAIPVLAGSAAYAVAELYEWPSSLEARLPRALGFYSIIAAATAIGFGLTFTPINPIRMLIWSAVINGVIAVPIMIMMMLIISHEGAMGRFRANRRLTITGWGATALMGATVVAMIVSMLV